MTGCSNTQVAYGAKRNEFPPMAAPKDLAGNLVAERQGTLLVARACGDDPALQGVRRTFWKNLGSERSLFPAT